MDVFNCAEFCCSRLIMLDWKKGNIEKTVSVLQYCIVYYYNGAQRYEQFLQVGQLYSALILFV